MRPARWGFATAIGPTAYQLQVLDQTGQYIKTTDINNRVAQPTGSTVNTALRPDGGSRYDTWVTPPAPSVDPLGQLWESHSVNQIGNHPFSAGTGLKATVVEIPYTVYNWGYNYSSVSENVFVAGSQNIYFNVSRSYYCPPSPTVSTVNQVQLNCNGFGYYNDKHCASCSEFATDGMNVFDKYQSSGGCQLGVGAGCGSFAMYEDDAVVNCEFYDYFGFVGAYECQAGINPTVIRTHNWTGTLSHTTANSTTSLETCHYAPVLYADSTYTGAEITARAPKGETIGDCAPQLAAHPIHYLNSAWVGGPSWLSDVKHYDPTTCTFVSAPNPAIDIATYPNDWPLLMTQPGYGYFITTGSMTIPVFYDNYVLVGTTVAKPLFAGTKLSNSVYLQPKPGAPYWVVGGHCTGLTGIGSSLTLGTPCTQPGGNKLCNLGESISPTVFCGISLPTQCAAPYDDSSGYRVYTIDIPKTFDLPRTSDVTGSVMFGIDLIDSLDEYVWGSYENTSKTYPMDETTDYHNWHGWVYVENTIGIQYDYGGCDTNTSGYPMCSACTSTSKPYSWAKFDADGSQTIALDLPLDGATFVRSKTLPSPDYTVSSVTHNPEWDPTISEQTNHSPRFTTTVGEYSMAMTNYTISPYMQESIKLAYTPVRKVTANQAAYMEKTPGRIISVDLHAPDTTLTSTYYYLDSETCGFGASSWPPEPPSEMKLKVSILRDRR